MNALELRAKWREASRAAFSDACIQAPPKGVGLGLSFAATARALKWWDALPGAVMIRGPYVTNRAAKRRAARARSTARQRS